MEKTTASQNQMKANKVIASTIESDEKEAFRNATNVKRCLTIHVNEGIFLTLINLCHKIGFDNFSNSLALRMANANASEATIKKYVALMLKRN